MRRSPLRAFGIMGVSALALTGCQTAEATADDTTITIATIPLGEDPTQANPIDALVELLEAETGYTVEVTDVPDYLSVVDAIRADHVDMGIMSGFPSALAVNTGKVDALLAWEGSEDPVSTCVVLNDSPVQELTDLEGKVDAACTSIMLTELGAPMFPFADGEWRGVGVSAPMPVMGSVLGSPELSDEKRTVIQDAIQAVFVEENAEALGALGSGFIGLPVSVNPEPSVFDGFVEIAGVAGVQLEDLE